MRTMRRSSTDAVTHGTLSCGYPRSSHPLPIAPMHTSKYRAVGMTRDQPKYHVDGQGDGCDAPPQPVTIHRHGHQASAISEDCENPALNLASAETSVPPHWLMVDR